MFEGEDAASIRMLMSIFVNEICEKSDFCLRAIYAAQDELNKEQVNVPSVFFHLKTALLHSSGVSLAFWPVKENAKMRGEMLRNAFTCEESIAFFRDRSFRNHLSHLDERIDNWWLTSTNRNIARNNIADSNAISGIQPSDEFERLDPTNATLVFRGDVFRIPDFSHHCKQIYFESEKLSQLTWWDEEFISFFPIK